MSDVQPQTDTPTTQPPSRLGTIKAFIGDLARPFAIYVTSLAAAIATVRIATAVSGDKLDFSAAAIFIAAVFAGVGALYGVKSWEVAKGKAADAEVAKAQTTGTTP